MKSDWEPFYVAVVFSGMYAYYQFCLSSLCFKIMQAGRKVEPEMLR